MLLSIKGAGSSGCKSYACGEVEDEMIAVEMEVRWHEVDGAVALVTTGDGNR